MACANDEIYQFKVAVVLLQNILFTSFSSGKQQLVEKVVNSGEHIMDRTDPGAPEDQSEIIDEIIATVAKDSATNTTRSTASIHKQASFTSRRPAVCAKTSETMSLFIEHLVSAEQEYMKMSNADRELPKFQNVSMLLVSNSPVSSFIFIAAMNNQVQTSKAKPSESGTSY